MKKIIKLCFIVTIISIIFGIGANTYATIDGKIELNTEKSEYSKDEQVSVEVKLCNLNADNGIIAFVGELEYDKNNLEYLGMEGKNGWATPSYNEANGKFVSDRNTYSENNEVMFQINFKVKSESAENVKIAVKNIEISNGTYGTFKDATTNITIKINSNTQEDNTNTNTQDTNTNTQDTNTNTQDTNTNSQNTSTNANTQTSSNLTSKANTTIKSNTSTSSNNKSPIKLPYAGNTNVFVIILLILFIVSALIYYVKYVRVKKSK